LDISQEDTSKADGDDDGSENGQRKNLNIPSDDSCDQVPVRESSRQPAVAYQHREILNKAIPDHMLDSDTKLNRPKYPGIVDIRSHVEDEERRKKDRETKAAVTI